MLVDTINNFERSLIDRFQYHPLFCQLQQLEWDDFLTILIQRRFLSLSIVNIYEFVIDGITDDEIKRTVRGILNEEYPRNTKGIPLPSHRELLFHDLIHLGVSRERILTTPETAATHLVRAECDRLLITCLNAEYSQVGLVTFLRFWAEVLVSIEYACLWTRISERLSDGRSADRIRSEFYYFHKIHDSRSSDIGEESILGGLTHSQELAIHLHKLISSEPILHYCMDIENAVYQLKYQFYNQFIDI